MATLKDIAKIAQVNVSTVSKALRNSSDLSNQTISMIQGIADELNYPYNSDSDKNKNSKIIGVIIPEVISPYYTSALESMRKRLLSNGYRLLIMISGFSEEEETTCVQQLITNNVCAVVCFSEQSEFSQRLRDIIAKNNIVFLMVSVAENYDVCDSICVDDWQSATLAVQHLVDLGHRRIAFLGDFLSDTRRRAYENVLKQANISVNSCYIFESTLRFEECGYTGMKKLLENPLHPTAVFAAYDNIAIGAMRAIYEAGLKIPRDISIVSIDDINVVRYLNPRLTTVTEPTQDLGELASDLLIMKIKGKRKIVQNVKLKPTLNIRETTSPPRNNL